MCVRVCECNGEGGGEGKKIVIVDARNRTKDMSGMIGTLEVVAVILLKRLKYISDP